MGKRERVHSHKPSLAPSLKRDKASDKEALKWILSVSKPQLPAIIAIIISEALWAVLGTLTALFSMVIVNSAVNGDSERMYKFIGIYLVVALSLTAIHAIMRYVNEKCKAKLEILFRKKVFSTMLSKRYPDLATLHSGELINRLTSDVGVISDAVTSMVPQAVMMFVRLICAMAVLIKLQWYFAVFFGAGGIAIYLASKLLKVKIQKYHREMQVADGKTRSFWQEIFENLIAIKSFSAEKASAERADALMKDHYKLRLQRTIITALSMFGTGFIVRFGHIFAVGYGAFCLLMKTMDYGTLTALIQLVTQVQQPFAQMSGIMPRYYSALSSAKRLMEIDEFENDSIFGAKENAEELYSKMEKIEFSNVSFMYEDDNNPILENCSFYINKGDFVSITGMSGIGKSSLFKLLLDIFPKTSGRAEIVSKNGERTSLSGLTRPLFAYVPQGNMLLSGTIRENLLFVMENRNISQEKINRALECACADSFIKELPDGLETRIGENGTGLSEGQVQRIAVARAILSDSPVLLFDEATSALDKATEAKLLTNIKDMTDKTCIIVTHRKSALEICNRHFVFEGVALYEK